MGCNANALYRGDDSGAFGQQLLKVEVNNPHELIISRLDIKIGDTIVIPVNNPTFPLFINLTAQQTAILKDSNKITFACYDQFGLKKTCKGYVSLKTLPRQV